MVKGGNLAFAIICLAILIPLTIWRRSLFPIKGKQYQGLIALSVCLGLAQLQYAFEFDCWSNVINGYFLVLGAAMVYTLRGFILIVHYKISDEIRALNAGGPVGWYLQHRKWISAPYLATILAVEFILIVIAFLAYLAMRGWTCERERLKSTLVRNVMLVLQVLVGGVEAWVLKDYKRDLLGIKLELTVTAVAVLITVVAFEIGSNIIKSQNQLLSDVTTQTAMVVVILVSVVWPILLSFRNDHQPHQELKSALAADPKLRDSFFTFLQTEFSTENLLFWEEVQRFQAELLALNLDLSSPPVHGKERANEVLERFILVNAPLAVNIGSTTRNETVSVVHDWKCPDMQAVLTVFHQAEAEVYKLMNNDSLPRYLQKVRAEMALGGHHSRRPQSSQKASHSVDLEINSVENSIVRPTVSSFDAKGSSGEP